MSGVRTGRQRSGVYPNEARGSRESRSRETATWTPYSPGLRIGRFATIKAGPSDNALDMREWLEDVGRRNYGIGQARSLGSVAVTYVRATEIGRMIEAKYHDRYRKPAELKRIHRRLARVVQDFVRTSGQRASDQRLEAVVYDRQRRLLDEYVADNDVPRSFEAVDCRLSEAEQTALNAELYVAAPFKISGVQLYGGGGYGLDLSTNETLHAERRAILGHLHDSEGLNPRGVVDPNWVPHATVFDFHGHIQQANIKYGAVLPGELDLDAPGAHMFE